MIFHLEAHDESDSELDESDNESYIYESEEVESSDFSTNSESETENEEPVRIKSNKGRPFKSINDLDEQSFKKRTENIYRSILDFLDQPENKGLDISVLLSKIGRRACGDPYSRHYDYEKSQMFSRIAKGENAFNAPVFEPIDGLVLKSFLVIGEKRMNKLRKFFALKNIKLPSTKKITQAEKELLKKTPFEITDTCALRIPMRKVFEKQCKDSIELRTNLTSDQIPSKLHVEGCTGFDGSGRHSMHSNQETNTHNFILGGCRCISIKDDQENCLHLEESLGVETELPLFIQPGKETLEIVNYLWSHMEEEILDLRENPIECTILEKQVKIHCNVEPTQFDNSCLDKICGLNGAYCKQCHHTAATANVLNNIQEGFTNTRTLEETLRRYDELLQHSIVLRGQEFMKIPSEVRKGITHKPLGQGIISVQNVITPLHNWINTCNHKLHLGYHFNSRLMLPNHRLPPRGPGKKKTDAEKKAIESSTKEFREQMWNGPAKIPADRPDPTGSITTVCDLT